VSGMHPTCSASKSRAPGSSCEVLQLLARGHSNAEVASRLFISEGTVKTHVTRVLMKLRLRDRAQAIVLTNRHGLSTAD
jgi:DNA-binding NarL/FixJ family response regulator